MIIFNERHSLWLNLLLCARPIIVLANQFVLLTTYNRFISNVLVNDSLKVVFEVQILSPIELERYSYGRFGYKCT